MPDPPGPSPRRPVPTPAPPKVSFIDRAPPGARLASTLHITPGFQHRRSCRATQSDPPRQDATSEALRCSSSGDFHRSPVPAGPYLDLPLPGRTRLLPSRILAKVRQRTWTPSQPALTCARCVARSSGIAYKLLSLGFFDKVHFRWRSHRAYCYRPITDSFPCLGESRTAKRRASSFQRHLSSVAARLIVPTV